MSMLPPARRRIFGAALRRARTQSGYSLDRAAAVLACHRSKISRMETGQRGIRPAELRDLLDAYRTDAPHRDTLLTLAEHLHDARWWRIYRYDADAYQDLLWLAAPGAALWVYEAQFIPGLLQTEDYTRGIAAAALATAGHEAREQFVQKRLARQQVFITGAEAAGLSAIVGEAALQQIVTSRAVMRGQLGHLTEVSDSQRNVTVQVLPLTSGTHAASSGPFTVISFPGPPTVPVIGLAGQTVGVYLDDKEDVERYALIFQQLRAAALPPAESARMIKSVAKSM
jgi:transcriptional regulator with XRE-family HTH domain